MKFHYEPTSKLIEVDSVDAVNEILKNKEWSLLTHYTPTPNKIMYVLCYHKFIQEE